LTNTFSAANTRYAMPAPDAVQLDREDINARSTRSREALLGALERLSEDRFSRAAGDEWSAATLLRHVVWVEFYWTGIARAMRESAKPVLQVDRTLSKQLAVEASELAGTPPEPLPEPPPYATRDDALTGLATSRRVFDEIVASLTASDLHRAFTSARGTASLRFALEHIIEHDWDHAVQLTAMTLPETTR
jgi:uncharacterized damage-inducible protein DinB